MSRDQAAAGLGFIDHSRRPQWRSLLAGPALGRAGWIKEMDRRKQSLRKPQPRVSADGIQGYCWPDSRRGWPRRLVFSTFGPGSGRKVDQDFLDDLESRLLRADVGVKATDRIIDRVRRGVCERTADEELVAFRQERDRRSCCSDPAPGGLKFREARPDGASWSRA